MPGLLLAAAAALGLALGGSASAQTAESAPATTVAPAPAAADGTVSPPAEPPAAPAAAPAAVPAGTSGTRGSTIGAEEIEARIKAGEAAQDLPESDRKRLVELYRFALSRLETAAGSDRARAEMAKLIEGGPARTQALQKELRTTQLEKPSTTFLREPYSAAELEQRLIKEQTALTARRSQLNELEKEATALQIRPAEAKTQLAEARAKLAEIETESKSSPPANEPTEITEARQITLGARALARRAQIADLEQELLSFDIRSQLVAAERALAVAKLAINERQVQLYEGALASRRTLDAEAVQRKAEEREREVVGKHPIVREMAERNTRLGEEVAKLVKNRAWVTERRTRIGARLKELESSERTARKGIDIAGLSPALGQILRNQRTAVAGIDDLLGRDDRREALTADAGLRLFEVTEAGEALDDRVAVVRDRMSTLDAEVSASDRAGIEEELSEFTEDQATLLQKLRAGYTGLLGDLVELDFEQRQLATQANRFQEFLDQHLIWTPSAPAMGKVSVDVQRRALVTFFDPRNWLRTARAVVTRAVEKWHYSLAVALLLAVLLGARPRIRKAIEACNGKVNRLRQETFANTPIAIALCVLWVLPVPLLLAYVSLLLRHGAGVDEFARAAGAGLRFGAVLLFLAHGLRVMCKAGGVAERHLRWPRPALDELRRRLFVLLYPVPVLAFGVAMTLAHPEPEMSQTVGRLFFILLEFSFAWFFARAFHPAKGMLAKYLDAHPGSWQARLRYVWWFLLVLTPLALLVTAAVGYAYTAAVLGELLLFTVWMIAGVVVLHAMVIRWLAIAQRRMVFKQVVERREAARAAAEASGEEVGEVQAPALDEPEVDLAAIHAKARHLLNSVVGVSLAVGLVLIWAPVVPAFGIFDSVELWTAQGMVEGKQVIEAVTLGDVLLALLVVIVVSILARDLPGFLEFAVLQRLPLAAGSRYAISSLSQYGFVTLGALFVFGKLGLRWSEVQWLVAALSVGLGFGLQEIVANFVSGIILLFERPIRIGDVVTVGNLTGTVSRIRIRATTITDFDNKEIVVPNKTFITGDLVNWTLTDSVTRVVIMVGIAYGSDTDKAHEIMRRVATENPLVLTAPEPQVFFLGFGDSSLNFEIRVWVRELGNRLPATDQIHSEVNRGLAAAGISIPFPQRDVHVKTIDGILPGAQSPPAAGGEDAQGAPSPIGRDRFAGPQSAGP